MAEGKGDRSGAADGGKVERSDAYIAKINKG